MAMAITLIFPLTIFSQGNDDLDNYIQRLKKDKAGALLETGYLSAGSDFLYAQEYFDAKNYSSAQWYFMSAVNKATDNAFANYQLALSLLKQNDQNKTKQAQQYLDAAFRLNRGLKERYKVDVQVVSDIEKMQPVTAKNNSQTLSNQISPVKKGGLKEYMDSLKYSHSIGGTETSNGTAGREAVYGIEFYEANDYSGAETSFALALTKDPNNAYINYLMALSLANQEKMTLQNLIIKVLSRKTPRLLQAIWKMLLKEKITGKNFKNQSG